MREVRRVRMDDKGRVVIPASLRESLGLKDGGEFMVVVVDGVLILVPVHE